MVFIVRTFDQQLHLNSGKESFYDAKDLRQNQTDAESILWSKLRNRKCNGMKFRRQHPILSFVADYYCHEKKLIVEVDGSVHLSDEVLERDKA
ncbi:MAG TPA: endonuclease domain-containing protein, partial [Lentimicrobium sp.]|nr:endonuclease domain-containing protein [Lentimicrobium sp.]